MGSITRSLGDSTPAPTVGGGTLPTLRPYDPRAGTSSAAIRAPLRVPTPAAPYVPMGFPVKVGGNVPYSTQNEAQALAPPIATFQPNRNILESTGDVMGQALGGQEINLGNFVPFIAERPAVLAVDILGSLGDWSDSLLGKGNVVGGVLHGAHDVGEFGLIKAGEGLGLVAAPVAAVLNAPANYLKTDWANEQASFARNLSNPNLSLDQAVHAFNANIDASTIMRALGGGPAGVTQLIGGITGTAPTMSYVDRTVGQLRSQGLGDDAIRRILYDGVNLPDAVKGGVVADPKADVGALIDQNGGLKWDYRDNLTAEVTNFIGDNGALVLTMIATGVGAGAVRGALGGAGLVADAAEVSYGSARIARAAAGPLPAPLAGLAKGLGYVERAAKLEMTAGLAVYGGTKLVEAIVQTAGIEQAYDFLNQTIYSRPLSSDPATCFVGMIVFGMPGAKMATKLVTVPIGKTVFAVANRGIETKIATAGGDITGIIVNRLERMISGDSAIGKAIGEKFYSGADGALDMVAITDEVFGAALDLAIHRLPLIGEKTAALYGAIPDVFSRTRIMFSQLMPQVWKIILEEPEALAKHWQTTAWNLHMKIPGVTYDPEAMALLSLAFRNIKDKTASARAAIDASGHAVVGMADTVPASVIRSDRQALRDAYPEADAVVPNAYVTHLLAEKPGYRFAMLDDKISGPGTEVVARGNWTARDLDRAMTTASDQWAIAHGLNRTMALVDSLPENAPVGLIAKALQTDEWTVQAIMSEGKALDVTQTERLQAYLVDNGLKTFDEAAAMPAERLQVVALEHLKVKTGALYERGRIALQINTNLTALRTERARLVAAKDPESLARAAVLDRDIDAYHRMGIVVADPTHNPYTAELAGAAKKQATSDLLTKTNDAIVLRSQAVGDMDRLVGLEDLAEELIPGGHPLRLTSETALQTIVRISGTHGRVSANAPHWSDVTLRKMGEAARGKGRGFDDPTSAASWIRENYKLLDDVQQKRLRGAMGAGGTRQLDKILSGGEAATNTELAQFAGRSAGKDADWEGEVLRLADDYHDLMQGWSGPGREKTWEGNLRRTAAKQTSPVPRRLANTFIKSLTDRASSGRLTHAQAVDVTVAFRTGTTAQKIALIHNYGLSSERVSLHASMGVGDYWSPVDPTFLTKTHPENVAALERRIRNDDFHGKAMDPRDVEAIESAILNEGSPGVMDAIFDTDPLLADLAITALKAQNKFAWVGSEENLLVDWGRIDADMANGILKAAQKDLYKRTDPGGLIDAAILSNGARDAEIVAAGGKVVADRPMPSVTADTATASRLLAQPVEIPGSHALALSLTELGVPLNVRINEKVLADPALQRGMQTIGSILHHSSAARPNTVEGAIVALREIENGNATAAGIGLGLQADAQVAVARIVERAVGDAKSAGFLPGHTSGGVAAWMYGLEDIRAMRAAYDDGLTVGRGLDYGVKKAPMSSAPYERISTVDRLAAKAGKPSLYDEIMAGKFLTFDERISNDASQRALRMIGGSGEKVASAYARSPLDYLFGKLTNKSIATFVHEQFIARCVEQGVKDAEAEAVWKELELISRESAHGAEPGRGFLRRPGQRASETATTAGEKRDYATIHNIPNELINRRAKRAVQELHYADTKGKYGGSVPVWALDVPFAEYTGPVVDFARTLRVSASPVMRHIEDGLRIWSSVPGVGGKTVQVPASEVLNGLYMKATQNVYRTKLYPIFRFMSDIRFAAMELVEPYALGAGRAAFMDARYTGKGLMGDVRGSGRSAEGAAAMNESLGGGGLGGGTRRFDEANRDFEKVRTPLLEAEIKRLRAEQPELLLAAAREHALLDPKIKAEVMEYRTGGFNPTPEEFDHMLTAAAKADPELRDAIDTFANGNTGQWLDEVDALHARIMSYADPEAGLQAEIAGIIEKNPALAEIATHIGNVNATAWADVRELIYGRVDRARAERILNHPLMWWPLSYQIKATKWLGDLLFQRIGGIETRGLGAYTLDQLMAAHNRALAEDPDYSRNIENHRTLLFVASMLLPITPDQISVSASPILQVFGFGRAKNIAAIGPIYTVTNVLPKSVGEVWKDVRSWEALHDTPVVGELARRAAGATTPNAPTWNDTGWGSPADVSYVP